MKRGTKYFFAIGLLSAAMTFSSINTSSAAPPCDAREKVTSTLTNKFNEVPVHRGMTLQGSMVELFISDAGTFSVVVTMPTGISCLLTAGKHWQEAQSKPQSTSKRVEREF